MHIIFHTQYYPPETGAPQRRLHELAVELHRRGIQVTVLTAMPSYPQGRVYNGYGGLLRIEEMDGIRVIRSLIFPSQSPRMLPRLLSYFSFVLTSLLIGGWKLSRAEYLFTESPPLFLGLTGLLLAKWKRARWIFNIADLWPESAAELGLVSRGSLSYRLGAWLECFLYRRAWLITGQSQTILESIRERFPRLALYHLANGVDTSIFSPAEVQSANGNLHLVYAGLHGLAQGLDQVLLAAHRLKEDERITLTLVGDGPEKENLIRLSRGLGLDQVRFLASEPGERIPGILSKADALIVPLKVQLTGAVPSKLYEAMAMGKPVLLIAGSEAANIVIESECGLVIRPGDTDSLVEAIRLLLNDPEERRRLGANGRTASVLRHDRRDIADRFARLLLDPA